MWGDDKVSPPPAVGLSLLGVEDFHPSRPPADAQAPSLPRRPSAPGIPAQTSVKTRRRGRWAWLFMY